MVGSESQSFARARFFERIGSGKRDQLIIACWGISIVMLVQNKHVKRVYPRKRILTTTTK